MKNISMVFQSVYLFADTIENNIKFGCPDATHEQVVEGGRKRLAAMTLFPLCRRVMTL